MLNMTIVINVEENKKRKSIGTQTKNDGGSSIKWSDPVHFLKSQGNFFLSFPCTLFLHTLTPKIINRV